VDGMGAAFPAHPLSAGSGSLVKLGIIIIHYNASEDLARCLESLAANPPHCDHDVIVVDNSSRDPGLPAVQERFPAVHWLLSSENLGYARGANRGMAALAADYYLLLNPDIVVLPGSLDALLAFADAHPRAGVIGPQLLNEDGSIQDSCRRFYTLRTLLLRRTPLRHLAPRSATVAAHLMRDFDHRTARPVDWVLGGCLLVRRSTLERTGPLDERFFLYFEDVDFCFRMWQVGHEVLYTPDARFVHRHRRQSARGAFHRAYWLHLTSLISFYEKWGMLVYILKKWRGPLSMWLLWVLDMVALVAAFLGAYGLRQLMTPLFSEPLFPLAEYRPLLLYGLLLGSVTYLLAGRYRTARRTARGAGARLRQILVLSLLLVASSYLSHQQVFSRAVLLILVPLLLVTSALSEDIFHHLRRRMEQGYLVLERTLLVGDPQRIADWLRDLGGARRLGIDPVGVVRPASGGEQAVRPAIGRDSTVATGRSAGAGEDLALLGDAADLPALAERHRASQILFWQQPASLLDEPLLQELHRRRLRLRWCHDEAWLVMAGAQPELLGTQVSAVLDPVGGSFWRRLIDRPTAIIAGALLLVVAGPLHLGLAWWRRRRGLGSVCEVACRDIWQRSFLLRVACGADGCVLPIWWQPHLGLDLLRGRLGLWGTRLRPLSVEGTVLTANERLTLWRSVPRPPGLTGWWAAADPGEQSPSGSFSFGTLWVILRKVAVRLLRDPGGLGRLSGVATARSPERAESPSSQEVP
jgi:GT2 family glycosyltransferase